MPSDYNIETDVLLQNMVIAVGISKESESIDNREINFVKAKLSFQLDYMPTICFLTEQITHKIKQNKRFEKDPCETKYLIQLVCGMSKSNVHDLLYELYEKWTSKVAKVQ